MSEEKQNMLEIPQYAMQIVNEQILSRSEAHKDDKSAYYGFSPIAFLFAVMNDDSMLRNLFEMNIINHFLKDMKPHAALEVTKCLLIIWKKTNSQIKSFDVEKIKAEIRRIDEELAKKAAEDAEKKEAEHTAQSNDMKIQENAE